MITGVECAGLVLAVLPLVIEAAKIYADGVNNIKDVTLTSRRDEKLQDFYETFLSEISLLHELIQHFVGSVPSLSDEKRQQLLKDVYVESWRPNREIGEALTAYFGPSLGQFERHVRSILKLLDEIVSEPTNRLTACDTNEAKMCAKLEALVQSRNSKTSRSHLKERISFWKKEETRKKKLAKLEKHNEKLERLFQRCSAPPATTALESASTKSWQSSIDKIQALGRILYGALVQCWKCSCGTPHEARFSLKSVDQSVVVADVVEGNFDFLIHTTSRAGHDRWQEGNILVRNTTSRPTPSHETLAEMCTAAKSIPGGMCLQVLVEDLQGTPKSWKLCPQPQRLKLKHARPAITLQELLKASRVESVEFKKELALTIALSLLGLEEGTWLRRGWSKNSISFFHATADDKLDIARPFISTSFEHDPASTSAPSGSQESGHRNPRILQLGIMLIEIELGCPIESFRAEVERLDGDGEGRRTDFGIADHVAERRLIGSSYDYREAVQACLRTPWVPGDQEVSLSDPRVRLGIYSDVVLKLRNEISYMLRRTF